MEEPGRVLTRLGLNLIRNLFLSKSEHHSSSMNSYFDNLHLQSKTVSDQMSVSQSGFDNHALSNSSLGKKRNKQWRAEDELKLAELIR